MFLKALKIDMNHGALISLWILSELLLEWCSFGLGYLETGLTSYRPQNIKVPKKTSPEDAQKLGEKWFMHLTWSLYQVEMETSIYLNRGCEKSKISPLS